jgi:hypothetical protein
MLHQDERHAMAIAQSIKQPLARIQPAGGRSQTHNAKACRQLGRSLWLRCERSGLIQRIAAHITDYVRSTARQEDAQMAASCNTPRPASLVRKQDRARRTAIQRI